MVRAGERAAAQGERSDGACGFGVGDADKFQIRSARDGHGGNERDAHTGADESEQAGELAAFENDLRGDASAIASGHGIFAEAVAVAEKKKRFLAEISKRDCGTAGELVFFGECGEERLGEERQRFKFVAANGQSEDGQIESAGAEAFEEDGGNIFDDGDGGFGKTPGKSGQDGRKEIRRDGRNDADVDLPGDGVLAFADVAASGLEFAEYGAGAGEERFTGVSEADGTA